METEWLNQNFHRVETIDTEIEDIENEIAHLVESPISFDKYDYIMLVAAGVTGGLIDVVMGRPGSGYQGANQDSVLGKFNEPTIKNDSFWGLGEKLKPFDLKNNPIDAPIPGISVGDHRLYSYGHDIFRALQSINLIMTGQGPIGIDPTEGLGGELSRGLDPRFASPDAMWKAVIVLALHWYKDYWSSRSLPIPGSTWIAHINGDVMPEWLDEATNQKDFNLRTLSAQALSVAVIEVMIGIHMAVRGRGYKSEYSDAQIAYKKQKMLLASHAVGMAFNLGKIYATGNPYYLNMPQVLRIAKLAFSVVAENSRQTHKAKESAMLSQIRTQLQLQKTLMILSDACYIENELLASAELNLAKARQVSASNEARTSLVIAEMRKKLSNI